MLLVFFGVPIVTLRPGRAHCLRRRGRYCSLPLPARSFSSFPLPPPLPPWIHSSSLHGLGSCVPRWTLGVWRLHTRAWGGASSSWERCGGQPSLALTPASFGHGVPRQRLGCSRRTLTHRSLHVDPGPEQCDFLVLARPLILDGSPRSYRSGNRDTHSSPTIVGTVSGCLFFSQPSDSCGRLVPSAHLSISLAQQLSQVMPASSWNEPDIPCQCLSLARTGR